MKNDSKFATGKLAVLEFDLLQINLILKEALSSVNVLVLAE